jgi:hypothetical protein
MELAMTKALIVSTVLVGSLFLTAVFGCGYSSMDNELIAQPKKIFNQTPVVCPDRGEYLHCSCYTCKSRWYSETAIKTK